MKDKSKNISRLQSFTKYCQEHSEERFWQALRNWSGYKFIYGSMKPDNISNIMSDDYLEDTFYRD
jgi:hypothetical protein